MRQIKSTDDIKQLGTILSIWAHPDDESFLAAGVICAAVNQGQKTICITATKGEAGNQNPSKWQTKDLAKIRSVELKKALEILGVKNHFWLDYLDGCCCDVPSAEAVQRLVEIANEFSPDSILTFGPDGWTGHEDHKTIHDWAIELSKKLQRQIPVYTVTSTPELYEEYYKPADKQLNIFFNIDKPRLVPAEKCDIYFELPGEIRQKKMAALAASPSQTEVLFEKFNQEFLTEAFSTECFVLASTD